MAITINGSGITSSEIADGTITTDDISSSDVKSLKSGRKNLIINGAMQLAQRGTSITVAGSSIYTLDRWSMRCDATTVTATQETDTPTGFATSLKLTNGTGSSGSGSDSCYIRQHLEGYNTNHLEIGTANAKTVTLSFWVKSSITGTYIVSFIDSGSDNGYPASYTISSADTWEKKTITLTLSDYGSWAGSSTTARNLTVHFDFGSGSDRDLTSLNAWNDGTTNAFSHSSQTDWVGTTGATLYLTGVQLELGSVATDFEHRSYGEELALCQRYYQKMQSSMGGQGFGAGFAYSSTALFTQVFFPTVMRAAPSKTYSSLSDFRILYGTGTKTATDSETQVGTYGGRLGWTTSGLTAGDGIFFDATNTTAYIAFDAEL